MLPFDWAPQISLFAEQIESPLLEMIVVTISQLSFLLLLIQIFQHVCELGRKWGLRSLSGAVCDIEGGRVESAAAVNPGIIIA